MTEKEAFESLDKLYIELTPSGEAVAYEGVNIGDLCSKYQAIKKYLNAVLWIVEKIPGFGAKVAAAIRFLMAVADTACPSS